MEALEAEPVARHVQWRPAPDGFDASPLARSVRRLSAILVMAAGALALVLSQFAPALFKAAPGLNTVHPVTALCFVLSAGSLALLGPVDASALAKRLGVGLALLVGVIACLRLSNATFSSGLFVDQLFTPLFAQAPGAPSRMASNSAFNFLLLAAGLAVMRHPGRVSTVARVLTMVVVLISYATLLGYAYRAAPFTPVTGYIPMPLTSACCFLVICIGVFTAAGGDGGLGIITRKSPGGRLLRRLLPLMLGAPPLLGWLRLTGEFAGLFGQATGVVLMVAVMIIMGISLAFWNANVVDGRERDKVAADEAIQKLAHFDALTGLPNRSLFWDRLQHALAQGIRHDREVALLYLDLDHFKSINDTFGHAVGDQVLAEAARRLQSCVRTSDTAARWGGDEFTAILTEVSDRADVKLVTERILQELERPFHVEGRELALSASIGVATSRRAGPGVEELLQRADQAMYCAKLKRNRCTFYSELPPASPVAPKNPSLSGRGLT